MEYTESMMKLDEKSYTIQILQLRKKHMATTSFQIYKRPCINKQGIIKSNHNYPYSPTVKKHQDPKWLTIKCLDCGLRRMRKIQ